MFFVLSDPPAKKISLGGTNPLRVLECPSLKRLGNFVLKGVCYGEMSFALNDTLVLQPSESLNTFRIGSEQGV